MTEDINNYSNMIECTADLFEEYVFYYMLSTICSGYHSCEKNHNKLCVLTTSDVINKHHVALDGWLTYNEKVTKWFSWRV